MTNSQIFLSWGFNNISFGTALRPRPAERKLAPEKIWGGRRDDAAVLSAKRDRMLGKMGFQHAVAEQVDGRSRRILGKSITTRTLTLKIRPNILKASGGIPSIENQVD